MRPSTRTIRTSVLVLCALASVARAEDAHEVFDVSVCEGQVRSGGVEVRAKSLEGSLCAFEIARSSEGKQQLWDCRVGRASGLMVDPGRLAQGPIPQACKQVAAQAKEPDAADAGTTSTDTADGGYAKAPPMTEDLTKPRGERGPAADAGTASSTDEGYAQAPPMTEDLTKPAPTRAEGPRAEQGEGTEAAHEEAVISGTAETKPEAGGSNAVNGYLSSRTQFQRARVNGLIPTTDVPQLEELFEVNVQLKHTYAERGFGYGDLSAFGIAVGNFRALGPDGEEIVIPAHDVPVLHPFLSLNELYVSQDFGPSFNLLVGKKRVVWGSGFSNNPTDLINPPKDPTDPNFQRAGAWMLRGELNLGNVAFTGLVSPAVTTQFNGLPASLWRFPRYSPGDDGQGHYLFAARAYALIANSDVNVMAFYSNRYNDDFEHKFRVGASFSRYFFTDYELHVEALFQTGSVRRYPNPDCLPEVTTAAACVRAGKEILEQSRLTDDAILPHVLVGTRRQFDDESLLSIEYLYQADGFTTDQFQQYVTVLDLNKQTRAITATIPNPTSGTTPDLGIPQKFNFDPLGKHYLFVTYSKPKIFNDWTAGVTVIANLADLSTLLAPSLAWSTTEWLTLTGSAFVPIPGPESLGATTASGEHFSEYSLIPNTFRVLFEARLFY